MSSTVKIYDVGKPKFSLSYWQLAAIGVPVVGLGVWWYFKSSKTKGGDTSKENHGRPLSIGKISESTIKQKYKPQNESSKSPLKKEENGLKIESVKTPLERAQSLKNSGNTFFKEEKYNEAIRCYSEAIDLCPVTETEVLSTFYQNRAACHDQMKNLPDMIKDCSAALELKPKYMKALSRRAKAHQSMGNLVECLEDVTALCILEQFQNQKNLELADNVLKDIGRKHAKEAMANRKPIPPSPHFVKTYFTSFPNDPVINASDFEIVEVNSAENNSSLSHLERAKQLLFRGRYMDVIPACTEAIEQGEGLEPEALLLRGTLYLLCGQHSLAHDDLNTIIDSQVQNNKITVNALIKRATLYLQLNDEKDKILQDFATAESLDPDNPDIYLHRGQVNLLSENLEDSINDFKKAISLDPDFSIAIMQGYYAEYRRAVQQSNMSGIAKVIEKFKRGIKKFPSCSESHTLLAQIYTDQQNFDDADTHFKEAIRLDPTNATLRVHRGLLYLQWKGDIDFAMKSISEGIQVDERCSFCYETLGTIEVQRANLTRAVELFNKAIPLSRTEMELSHIFSLLDAAKAQQKVVASLGLSNFLVET